MIQFNHPKSRTAPARRARTPADTPRGFPEWVRQLDLPVWVTGPDRTLQYLNRKAERLLGVRGTGARGKPCHLAVAARDPRGRAICGASCAIGCRAERGAAQPTVEAIVGRPESRERRTRWTVIPVPDDRGGTWLVHTASDLGRARECEAYVERVALRSAALRETDPAFEPRPLRPRESEILGLLADDREQGEIARELGISQTTVRNHIQRLTAAIGAHSVHEAVAMRLLGRV